MTACLSLHIHSGSSGRHASDLHTACTVLILCRNWLSGTFACCMCIYTTQPYTYYTYYYAKLHARTFRGVQFSEVPLSGCGHHMITNCNWFLVKIGCYLSLLWTSRTYWAANFYSLVLAWNFDHLCNSTEHYIRVGACGIHITYTPWTLQGCFAALALPAVFEIFSPSRFASFPSSYSYQ